MCTGRCSILACFFIAHVFVSGCTYEQSAWIEDWGHGALSAWNSTTDEYDLLMSDLLADYTDQHFIQLAQTRFGSTAQCANYDQTY